jgi:hypothetical protein
MEGLVLGRSCSNSYACTCNVCVYLENRGFIVNKYDYWLESGADQECAADQQEYIWDTYMKPSKEYDVMNLEVFQEYLNRATECVKGAEKWENLREYADRGEWENFGRAIYYLVHDKIEDKLIAEEE